MFLLHERTRNSICRLGFLLGCLAPTVCLGGWLAIRQGEGYREARRAEWREAVGTDLSIGKLEFPRPNVVRVSEIALRPAFGLAAALSASTIEMVTTPSRIMLSAKDGQLDLSSVSELVRAISPGARGISPNQEIRAWLGQLHVRAGGETIVLYDVHLKVERAKEETKGTAWFRLTEGSGADGRIVVQVTEKEVDGTTYRQAELHTLGADAPTELLGISQSATDAIPAGCRFSGSIWTNERPEGWEMQIREGRLGFDLGRWVGDRFGRRVSGTAQLTIHDAIVRNGRIERASGTLEAGSGEIGESLLASLCEALGFRRAGQAPAAAATLHFDQVGVKFQMDGAGVAFKGDCKGPELGVAILQAGRPLLYEPDGPSGPAAQLAIALAAPGALLAPANAETQSLLSRLPIPPAAAQGRLR